MPSSENTRHEVEVAKRKMEYADAFIALMQAYGFDPQHVTGQSAHTIAHRLVNAIQVECPQPTVNLTEPNPMQAKWNHEVGQRLINLERRENNLTDPAPAQTLTGPLPAHSPAQ